MTDSLFRPEALDFQKQYREFGQVGRLQSVSLKMLAWGLVAAVGALIYFVCIAGYTRKETVAGYLAPGMGTAEVFSPKLGTVTAVNVSQDEIVQQGDVLLTIDTGQITVAGIDLNETILRSLSLQKELLTKQIADEERTEIAEKARLSSEIKSGELELAQMTSQMEIQQEQIKLGEKLVEAASKMHTSGYLSLPELYRRKESLLVAQQGLSSLKQRYVARQTELAQTRSALEQLPTTSARKFQPLRTELAQTDQRIAEVGGRQAFAIRSPISGRVANVQATVGQIADPKRLQLNIIPLDTVLQAVLFVPTRAIGFVRAGQKVRLLYDAFPFQRFGAYSGRVVSVSKTILTSGDVAGPIQLEEPAYKVIADLDRPDVDAHGQKIPLQAGMLLRADILLEQRALIHWLLDPIFSVRM